MVILVGVMVVATALIPIVVEGYGLNEAKWAGFSIEVPLELALFANVLGVVSAHAAGFYLTFLYLTLIQAVIVFVRLVNSLFAGVDDESP